jgi:hypothetical protein
MQTLFDITNEHAFDHLRQRAFQLRRDWHEDGCLCGPCKMAMDSFKRWKRSAKRKRLKFKHMSLGQAALLYRDTMGSVYQKVEPS